MEMLIGLLIMGAIIIYVAYKYQIARRKMTNEMNDAYRAAIKSGDKAIALDLGRKYYRYIRNGRLTIYDEQAITNDLSTM